MLYDAHSTQLQGLYGFQQMDQVIRVFFKPIPTITNVVNELCAAMGAQGGILARTYDSYNVHNVPIVHIIAAHTTRAATMAGNVAIAGGSTPIPRAPRRPQAELGLLGCDLQVASQQGSASKCGGGGEQEGLYVHRMTVEHFLWLPFVGKHMTDFN